MLTGSNKKKRHTMTAWPGRVAALIIVMAMSAACFAGLTLAEDDYSSLTVSLPTDVEDEGLKAEDLIVDLYQVAAGTKDSMYDTYNLEVNSDFTLIEKAISDAQVKVEKDDPESASNVEQWEDIAQDAADIVKKAVDNAAALEIYKTGTAAASVSDEIEPGLYLVLTHNTLEELSKKDKSFKSYFNDEDGITTVALTDSYEYRFKPQLIFLPAKTQNADGMTIDEGTFNTAADWGDWIHDAKIILKPSRFERFGSIMVKKSLTEKDADATFVFEVEAVKNESTVYSNVFTLNFSGTATENSFSVTKKIPVGSTVTVKEVYSGASYALVTPRGGIASDDIKDADAVVEFKFENRPVDGPGGTGILNTFTNGDNGWTWNPVYNRDSSSDTISEIEQ